VRCDFFSPELCYPGIRSVHVLGNSPVYQVAACHPGVRLVPVLLSESSVAILQSAGSVPVVLVLGQCIFPSIRPCIRLVPFIPSTRSVPVVVM